MCCQTAHPPEDGKTVAASRESVREQRACTTCV